VAGAGCFFRAGELGDCTPGSGYAVPRTMQHTSVC